jgi:hypothetical protein
MKVALAWAFALAAFGAIFSAIVHERIAAMSDVGSEPKDRQLQDDNEVEEDDDDQISFQLKMYWEEGYRWQEETFERKWCLECNGACSPGTLLEIQTCDGSSKQRFVYEEVPGSGGGRLKPRNRQDLCWTRQGAQVHELEPCDLNCRQIILGIRYEGRFEMHPNGLPLDCLEQHHHPRAGEVVRAKDCIESRDDDTSYWVMIDKKGGNYSDFVEEEEFLRGNTTISDFGNDFCDEDNKCSICQGGCDRDRDCQDGLECMTRDGNETVPGCEGADLEENDGLNVCYDPIGNYTLSPTVAPTTSPAPTPVVPTSPPVELYGDCEFSYPSAAPSPYPTEYPSQSPSMTPTLRPSNAPSQAPSLSAVPTSSPMPSLAPTYEGFCKPDENGMFGEEASNAAVVNYKYELVTDPSQDFDVKQIVSLVSQSIVQCVLPTLFSDECNEAPVDTRHQRRLRYATLYDPTGASTDNESILDGVNCTAIFDEAYDCSVINANMIVYTNRNETYDDLLLPIIKESTEEGALNNVHPAIVNITFVNQTASGGNLASSGGSSSGIQNPAWFALIGIGVVAIVAGFVVWKNRKEKQASGSQIAEVAPQSNMSKAVPIETSEKNQASFTPAAQNIMVEEPVSQDITFEIDSD